MSVAGHLPEQGRTLGSAPSSAGAAGRRASPAGREEGACRSGGRVKVPVSHRQLTGKVVGAPSLGAESRAALAPHLTSP